MKYAIAAIIVAALLLAQEARVQYWRGEYNKTQGTANQLDQALDDQSHSLEKAGTDSQIAGVKADQAAGDVIREYDELRASFPKDSGPAFMNESIRKIFP